METKNEGLEMPSEKNGPAKYERQDEFSRRKNLANSASGDSRNSPNIIDAL
jgi:hypothetical protein